MVLLTITPAIVAALGRLQDETSGKDRENDEDESGLEVTATDPALVEPAVGKPISHGQVVNLSRSLKSRGELPCHLDILLRGSRVYVPPPRPKPEPVRDCDIS